MSTVNISSIIEEALGSKPYCNRAMIIELCQNVGLCGSATGAHAILKALPWIRISPKRMVVTRSAALDYFSNLESHFNKKSGELD